MRAVTTHLDVAFDLIRSGLLSEASEILRTADLQALDGSLPIVLYGLGYIAALTGNQAEAVGWYHRASEAPPDYCFPSRLEELMVLESVLDNNPNDAKAHAYLGNLLYDRHRVHDATEHWHRAAELDPANSVVWRNLGIASFNTLGDAQAARSAFDRARLANPGDARLLYERDQFWKRIGIAPGLRLRELEQASQFVEARDDLTVELASLYNHVGRHSQAAALLSARKFQPWEGGEGLVLGQFVRTLIGLSLEALNNGDPERARRLLESTLEPPANLGEAWHLLANRSHVYYWLGIACEACGDFTAAAGWWGKAAATSRDFQDMSMKPYSEMTYYSAMHPQDWVEPAGLAACCARSCVMQKS